MRSSLSLLLAASESVFNAAASFDFLMRVLGVCGVSNKRSLRNFLCGGVRLALPLVADLADLAAFSQKVTTLFLLFTSALLLFKSSLDSSPLPWPLLSSSVVVMVFSSSSSSSSSLFSRFRQKFPPSSSSLSSHSDDISSALFVVVPVGEE